MQIVIIVMSMQVSESFFLSSFNIATTKPYKNEQESQSISAPKRQHC